MKTYLDCWISAATTLFSQALAGEPQLTGIESHASDVSGPAFIAELSGEITGQFTVVLDPEILKAPLLGDGVDQEAGWKDFLREIAEAAAGELLTASGISCRVETFRHAERTAGCSRSFRLSSPGGSWTVLVYDGLRSTSKDTQPTEVPEGASDVSQTGRLSPGVELLLDVELEAALRFGCCEMPLGEILELGPGDVVELDRHIDGSCRSDCWRQDSCSRRSSSGQW